MMVGKILKYFDNIIGESEEKPIARKHFTLEEAYLKTLGANFSQSLRYEDLFAVLETALKTITELQKRVDELEKQHDFLKVGE